MKELFKEIRKSRLKPEEIILINFIKSLYRSNDSYYHNNGTLYFKYYDNNRMWFCLKIEDKLKLDYGYDIFEFLLETNNKLNLFPDYEIIEFI